MATRKEKTGKNEEICCETKISETPEGVRIVMDAKGEGVKKRLEEFKKGDFSGCGCCSGCFTPTAKPSKRRED